MEIGNCCLFHSQETMKWTWFEADTYGRAILKSQRFFDTIEEALADYKESK